MFVASIGAYFFIMELSELRIGNRISAMGRKDVTVEGISIRDGLVETDGFACRGPEDFEPIPLTLDRIRGLKLDDFPFEIYGDNSRGFHIDLDGSWLYIKYLHQLQNLYFSLKSEELEIL